MTKPELPEWIDRIQERVDKIPKHPFTVKQVATELDGIGVTPEWCEFYAYSEKDIPALLQHCLKLREAIEEAPHHPDCAYEHIAWLDPEMGVIIKQERDPCNCWKSEALNTKPEGVL